MKLPSLTDPEGVFDYLIASILLLSLMFGILWAAIYFGVISSFF